jgi:diguanylate cyclase (GGDEF)-like protein/PAS domain S-box-containing protein
VRLPSIPIEEEARLEALAQYDLHTIKSVDTYLPLMQLARDLFGVSASCLSIVERDRQFFVVQSGFDLRETSRETSFCAHAILRNELLVVLDAALDPRFLGNPLVTGVPGVRFYAGVPLLSPSGHAIGTMCIADSKPRNAFDDNARRQLLEIAALVLDKLEIRRLDLARQAGQIRFETIAAASPDGIICADSDGVITFWNQAAAVLFGHTAEAAVGHSIDLIVPERLRNGQDGGLRRIVRGDPSRMVGRTVELNALRKDGSETPIEFSLSMWDSGDSVGFGAVVRDISQRRADEDRLFRLAHLDPLTELPNRAVLRSRIDHLGQGPDLASILVIDLDGFKNVNEGIGYTSGDRVLKEIGRRLIACVRATDTVSRLGGDEFALLLIGVGDHRRAAAIADAAIDAIAQPMVIDGHTLTISASAGIASFPNDGSSTDDLLANADLALYQAKAEGRHCRRVFTPALRIAAVRAREQENDLRHAYERREFEVFYQPQVRLSDGALVGAEALLRWRHPQLGLISPVDFMAALDRSPFSAQVGEWVLNTACAQAAAWRRGGVPHFRVGVNLFGSQFRAGDLVFKIRTALADHELPGSALDLEITENIILTQDEFMIRPLRELREAGVGIAFDDYGTGYASLSMLKRCPITTLKVDQTFVRGMCGSAEDAAIVRAILYLGSSFGFGVIAEGVETTEQAETLTEAGCQEAQGYLYGRPVPAKDFMERFNVQAQARAPALVH